VCNEAPKYVCFQLTKAGSADQLPLTQTREQEVSSGVFSTMKRSRNINDFADEFNDEEVCVACELVVRLYPRLKRFRAYPCAGPVGRQKGCKSFCCCYIIA
jgi:hypothetical protein